MGDTISQQAEGEQHPEQRLADALSKGGVGDGPALGPDQHQQRKAHDEEIDDQLELERRPIDHANRLNRGGVARIEEISHRDGADH
jgi:hypothetical protein